ncbi:hypothetical protein [Neisseria sp. Ec49-e6-T10]|uniref:hypothetical protein n=1 Tax=Neisseria sp. Ec49-e6-T10 TaxID=3140744 RepID=UPI003EBC4763
MDKKMIQDYLDTQNLALSTLDIQVIIAALHTVMNVSTEKQAETLKLSLPINEQNNSFDHGDINHSVFDLLMQFDQQQALLVNICAVLDSAQAQYGQDYLTLYVFPENQADVDVEEQQKPTSTLVNLINLYQHHPSKIQESHQVIKEVEQVGQSGWAMVVEDIKKWQSLHNDVVFDDLMGSCLCLPIHTAHGVIVGVLLAQQQAINGFSQEHQATLVALVLVLQSLLKQLNWRTIH